MQGLSIAQLVKHHAHWSCGGVGSISTYKSWIQIFPGSVYKCHRFEIPLGVEVGGVATTYDIAYMIYGMVL